MKLHATTLTLIVSGLLSGPTLAETMDIDPVTQETIDLCQANSESCAHAAAESRALLVFPEVTEVSLGVGGEGGSGVLVMDDKIQGTYSLAAASAGYEVGVETASYVFALMTDDAVQAVQDGEWMVGGDLDVVLGVGLQGDIQIGTDVVTYVFDVQGVQLQAALDLLRIKPTSE